MNLENELLGETRSADRPADSLEPGEDRLGHSAWISGKRCLHFDDRQRLECHLQPLLFASLNRALELVVELRQGVSRPPVEVEESTALIGRGPSEPASAPARIGEGGGHVGPRDGGQKNHGPQPSADSRSALAVRASKVGRPDGRPVRERHAFVDRGADDFEDAILGLTCSGRCCDCGREPGDGELSSSDRR